MALDKLSETEESASFFAGGSGVSPFLVEEETWIH
jgi:hypothetical protein